MGNIFRQRWENNYFKTWATVFFIANFGFVNVTMLIRACPAAEVLQTSLSIYYYFLLSVIYNYQLL